MTEQYSITKDHKEFGERGGTFTVGINADGSYRVTACKKVASIGLCWYGYSQSDSLEYALNYAVKDYFASAVKCASTDEHLTHSYEAIFKEFS